MFFVQSLMFKSKINRLISGERERGGGGKVTRDANMFAVQTHFQEIGRKNVSPFVIERFQTKPSDLVCRCLAFKLIDNKVK
jgi:hypothetical protein